MTILCSLFWWCFSWWFFSVQSFNSKIHSKSTVISSKCFKVFHLEFIFFLPISLSQFTVMKPSLHIISTQSTKWHLSKDNATQNHSSNNLNTMIIIPIAPTTILYMFLSTWFTISFFQSPWPLKFSYLPSNLDFSWLWLSLVSILSSFGYGNPIINPLTFITPYLNSTMELLLYSLE